MGEYDRHFTKNLGRKSSRIRQIRSEPSGTITSQIEAITMILLGMATIGMGVLSIIYITRFLRLRNFLGRLYATFDDYRERLLRLNAAQEARENDVNAAPADLSSTQISESEKSISEDDNSTTVSNPESNSLESSSEDDFQDVLPFPLENQEVENKIEYSTDSLECSEAEADRKTRQNHPNAAEYDQSLPRPKKVKLEDPKAKGFSYLPRLESTPKGTKSCQNWKIQK